MSRLAILTCEEYADLAADDRLFAEALDRQGVMATPVVWTASDAWKACDAVLVRSTWDYHLQPQRFADFLAEVTASGLPLWNPLPLIQGNSHKGYLAKLSQAGAAVIPTVFLAKGAGRALGEVVGEAGWDEVVVKPAVSAGAWGTWRAAGGPDDDARFAAQLTETDLLVQPFLPQISEGEWSLLYFDGVFSHAVLKRPKAGDFRVQAIHGGETVRAEPPPSALAVAADLLADLPETPLYARVDGCVLDGAFQLMELELIEPCLFFLQAPEAADTFARACVRRLA